MTSARSLEQWLRVQETVHGPGIDLGLERVRAVAERLQLLPFAPRTIIVAGTNGKGSTVACLEAMLRALGARVGTFTSPHLMRYNERIRVDGAESPDAELIRAFEAIDAVRGEITLTFFEYNALAALVVFRALAVEVAVLEVGLGGRLDAVNIVDAEAAIVCSIGLDHADWLGTDIEAIGREKAGVFRAGAIAVLADPGMTPSVEAEARRIGAQLVRAVHDYSWLAFPDGSWSFAKGALQLPLLPPPALRGSTQLANAAACLATLHAMGLARQEHASQLARALQRLELPGRFQMVPGTVEWILDVAHNPAAAGVLARDLAARPIAGRTLCVIAMLGDKDIPGVARELGPVVDLWFVSGIDAPRGLAAEGLAQRTPVFSDAGVAQDIVSGMRLAAMAADPGDRIVVCGSFLAVAPAMQALGIY